MSVPLRAMLTAIRIGRVGAAGRFISPESFLVVAVYAGGVLVALSIAAKRGR